jgi:hypothetical protein
MRVNVKGIYDFSPFEVTKFSFIDNFLFRWRLDER